MSYNAGPSYHGLTITIFEHLQIFFSAYSLFNIKTQELSDIKIRFDIDFTENVQGSGSFNEDNIVKIHFLETNQFGTTKALTHQSWCRDDL